jgi:putative ubiquitin-RnfH superfamily antitoxin RatB of RatAB toxin-antitoxin module
VSRPEITVSVVWAERDRQTVIELKVPAGTTAAGAVLCSAIHGRHPGIPQGTPLGIWGRLVPSSAVLEHGDRVELYRALPADPKEERRRLARQGRTMARRR